MNHHTENGTSSLEHCIMGYSSIPLLM